MTRAIGLIAIVGFMACIPAANWMIGNVGIQYGDNGPRLIPVGFGLMAPSGVLMVGVALLLRDIAQRTLGWRWTLLAIAAGGAVSGLLAPWALVAASVAAFTLSEIADMAVYTPMERKHLIAASVASNIAGAIVDSALFLLIAFGSLDFIAGQIVGKLWGTLAALPLIFAVWRIA